jgi:hypothetical protein
MKKALMLVTAFVLSWLTTASAATITQDITLFRGTVDDPYTVYYPLEIAEPGKIDIRIKIKSATPPIEAHKSPISYLLVDTRAFDKKRTISTPEWKQWIQKANRYNPAEYFAGDEIRGWVKSMKGLVKSLVGKKDKPKIPDYVHKHGRYSDDGTVFVNHPVDAPEFGKHQGRYILVMNNTSRSEVEQTLIIMTTDAIKGDTSEATAARPERCDLLVKRIAKNRHGEVFVTVSNEGKGEVPQRAYEVTGDRTPVLQVARNGAVVATIPLSELDPQRKLMTPRSAVSIKITAIRTLIEGDIIHATIDPGRIIRESNESNNDSEVIF